MKQHRSRLPVLLAPLLAVAITSTAFAGFVQPGEISKGDRVQVSWDGTKGNSYGGGEFKMRHDDGSGWNDLSIFTFCLEVDEHTQLNKDFIVGGLSDTSIFGSGGASDGGVALTHQTRFLYNAYATGTLSAATNFVSGSDPWADAFQRVIWSFQGQPDWQNWQSHATSAFDQELIDYANNNAIAGEDYGVFAMNLFTKSVLNDSEFANFDSTDPTTWADVYGYKAQDMLVYIQSPNPPPNQAVPEPATVTVWLVAMLGLVVAARRRMLPADATKLAA